MIISKKIGNGCFNDNPVDLSCKIVSVVGTLVIQYFPCGLPVVCLISSTILMYIGSPITGTAPPFQIFFYFWEKLHCILKPRLYGKEIAQKTQRLGCGWIIYF